MDNKNNIKQVLEQELYKVKYRIQILDLIEEKLYKMRELARGVVDNKLSKEEIVKTNQEVQLLIEQVRLLDAGGTQLS